MNPGNGSSIFLIIIIDLITKYFLENIHLLIFFKYLI